MYLYDPCIPYVFFFAGMAASKYAVQKMMLLKFTTFLAVCLHANYFFKINKKACLKRCKVIYNLSHAPCTLKMLKLTFSPSSTIALILVNVIVL